MGFRFRDVLTSWAVPSLADLLLAALVVRPYLLPGGLDELLSDASVGMHIRTGDLIRSAGSLPHTDPFSFALPGKEWFAWEWLTELSLSLLHSWFGLAAIALAAVVLMTATSALVLRNSLRRGESAFLGLLLVMVGFQTSMNHALARPHLITWLFLALSVTIVERERRGPWRGFWLLIPLAALWANLHGGFAILPVYLAVVCTGLGLEAIWNRTSWRGVWRMVACGLAVGAATVVNPYGIGLHQHLIEFVSSPWAIQMIEEYHPPSPSLGEPFYWFAALGALAGLTAVSALRRRGVSDALVCLFFLISACKSARHIPLFVIAVTPIVAGELRWLWDVARRHGGRRSLVAIVHDMDLGLRPQFLRHSSWLPSLFLLALAFRGPLGLPSTFPEKSFPVEMVERNSATLQAGRVFSTDAWGDYLIYSGYPRQRVFIDGLQDYFGPALGNDYLEMLSGGPRTEELFRHWKFDTALVPVKQPLSRWLKARPEWRVVAETPLAVLLVKEH
ncbi:hypothetical protein [uncultured Paludibaculum sp.]|uniref:hypothetical protein n=1 Tax=uncultured Paludibaculum sp. TaxID=1765020 RepID=UPI002AAB10F7|nr:hypothetical protein [uncultured Paludibaculum sp.]